jgi:broad specificity phosphatase PhoE
MDLVFVRHGESEGNVATARSKAGDNSLYTGEFQDRLASRWRLSERGCEQAKAAGLWLSGHGLDAYHRRYVSEYTRAMETASLLGTCGPSWYCDHRLRERDWGSAEGLRRDHPVMIDWKARQKRDPFYAIPPNGESMAGLSSLRLRPLFDTLHRECSDQQVLVVCHGEVMWGYMQLLERMAIQEWTKRHASKAWRIHNCQILHYTRKDPVSGVVSPHLDWVRSVCPWNEDLTDAGWRRIERPRYSDSQLAELVECYPRIIL